MAATLAQQQVQSDQAQVQSDQVALRQDQAQLDKDTARSATVQQQSQKTRLEQGRQAEQTWQGQLARNAQGVANRFPLQLTVNTSGQMVGRVINVVA